MALCNEYLSASAPANKATLGEATRKMAGHQLAATRAALPMVYGGSGKSVNGIARYYMRRPMGMASQHVVSDLSVNLEKAMSPRRTHSGEAYGRSAAYVSRRSMREYHE